MSGKTHFGYQEVDTTEKAQKVAGVFDSVAPKYDLMNDLMSAGMHRAWKAFAIALSGVRAGERVLDVASGSGDLARAFARRVGPEGQVWLTDINRAMLARGRGDIVFIGSDSAKHPRPYQGAYAAAKHGLEAFARVLEMETEGTGVRSILVRVGPTGSEFGNQMPKDKIPAILEAWKYWGVLRHLHWMPGTSVARAIARVVEIPVEESYPTILEIQPGGRAKEQRS